MAKPNISAQDREFFRIVSQAVFANPFGKERAELDRTISGQFGNIGRKKVIDFAINQVRSRLENIDQREYLRIDHFSGHERGIIEHVVLFDIFHMYIDQFDEHIKNQIRSADEPIEAGFVKEVLKAICKRGFDENTSMKYLAMFFQLRRAYHFIERGLIGQCDSMQQLRMNLWNNIFTCDITQYQKFLWDRMEDFSTLLLGPTGSGKGAAAAAIGRSGYIPFDPKRNRFSESFMKSFVSVNLSQYPESLLESELFGHTKGAFTGAIDAHKGLFAMCSKNGSVFLDEIGDVNEQTQIKLLQVLQERTFYPVGTHEKQRFAGRVIAATNKSVDQLRSKSKFRDDFYYRLCSDCIEVPSLSRRISENPEELLELVRHTVEQITGQTSEELTYLVMDIVNKRLGKDYTWPGNVRELEQCIRRIIIKRDYQGQNVQHHDLQSNLHTGLANMEITATELIAGYCKILYEKFGSFEETARRTGLDRRTVKKYIEMQ